MPFQNVQAFPNSNLSSLVFQFCFTANYWELKDRGGTAKSSSENDNLDTLAPIHTLDMAFAVLHFLLGKK